MLYPYQTRFNDAILASMAKGNTHVLGYLSQGGGKSYCIADMAIRAAAKNHRTLVLTHREEIFKQNVSKINILGQSVFRINPHMKNMQDSMIYCAMTKTLQSRINKFESVKEWMKTIDFLIIDEAHRCEYDAILPYLREDVWIVGVSATCVRTGTQTQLGETYQDIVSVTTTKELISLGYLTPSRNFKFQAPKLDDVSIDRNTGDYHNNQLQKRFAKPERYAGIIKNYLKICPNAKTAVFTTGSKHCIDLCKAFNNAGISAKYLLSKKFPKTDKEFSGDREPLLESFSKDGFKVLVTVGTVDTGWDEPTLEAVILDYSTKSYARYGQPTGRGSRLCKGKKFFYVLDFGDNIDHFGIYEDDPPIALWHKVGGGGVMPTKECPVEKTDKNGKHGCGRSIPVSARDCPFCKFHFETSQEVYEVELTELVKKEKDTMEGWIAEKKLAGWKNNWILRDICIKNKDNPHAAFMKAIGILRTKNGANISPKYWYFFKKNILKQKESPK